jgi:hypothetical protein
MKIIKIGTWVDGIPYGWHFDGEGIGGGAQGCPESLPKNTPYLLGLDLISEGSVDVNGVRITEWEGARMRSLDVEE